MRPVHLQYILLQQLELSGLKILGQSVLQMLDKFGIELDSDHVRDSIEQESSQSACAGTDLDDEIGGLKRGEVNDASTVAGVDEKVLTKRLLGSDGLVQDRQRLP